MKKYKHIILIVIIFLGKYGYSQNVNIILTKPTDTSITVSLLSDKNISLYLEWGTLSGKYDYKSNVQDALGDKAIQVSINQLKPNTRYYYRLAYKTIDNTSNYTFTNESTFITKRALSTTFSFAVEADPHLDTNCIAESFDLTLKHMLSKKIDFLVDLGDNTMVDKLPVINDSSIVERNKLFRKYFSVLNHSASLFITLGNHEGELGWLSNSNLSFLPTTALNFRKQYFPNPVPNGFYSGNSTLSSDVGYRENYYAWEWGDALFVVIDPYFYTKSKPGWGWTLGVDQYNWLSNTLKKSTSKYKFIFSHQLVGGSGTDGRGGTEFVHLYEMGGYNDDSTWGFAKFRPGWEMPIHKLFVETKVNIFFHGHDHCYGRQIKDGVIYQEVPQPSARNINTITGTAYGYKEGVFLPSRGYMLVTVHPDSTIVDYIRTYLPNEENANRKNGDIGYRYVIKTGLLTSIQNVINNDLLSVTPNPVNSIITIESRKRFNSFSYKLIDYSGKVYRVGKNYQIDVSDLASGLYVLQMTADGIYYNRKILVSK